MRISDWSSDVCSSDLFEIHDAHLVGRAEPDRPPRYQPHAVDAERGPGQRHDVGVVVTRVQPDLAGVAETATGEVERCERTRLRVELDRKSVVEGKRVAVRGDHVWRRRFKKKKK